MHHVLFWGGFFGIQIELKIWILPTRHKNIKEMDRATKSMVPKSQIDSGFNFMWQLRIVKKEMEIFTSK